MQGDGAGLDTHGPQQTTSASSTYNPWGNTSVLNMQQVDPVHLTSVQNTVVNQDLHQNLFMAVQSQDPQLIQEACMAVAAARADADLTRQQAESVISSQQQIAAEREAHLGSVIMSSEEARRRAENRSAELQAHMQTALEQQAGASKSQMQVALERRRQRPGL